MKPLINTELRRAINCRAQALSVQSFSSYRFQLEKRAKALIAEGKTVDEAIEAISYESRSELITQELF